MIPDGESIEFRVLLQLDENGWSRAYTLEQWEKLEIVCHGCGGDRQFNPCACDNTSWTPTKPIPRAPFCHPIRVRYAHEWNFSPVCEICGLPVDKNDDCLCGGQR